MIGGLWRFSRRSWISIDDELRPRSGASALKLFLFIIFFIVGLILVALGFGLGDVDNWLDAQSGWITFVADWAFSALCGLILLFCLAYAGAALFGRKQGERVPMGGLIAALVIGYFAWIGMTLEA